MSRWPVPSNWTTSRPASCPTDGPHQCKGVFGLATRENLTEVHFLACRVDRTADPQPDATHALMGAHGAEDTTLDEQYTTWIQSFLGLAPAEQDTAWENLDHETKVRLRPVPRLPAHRHLLADTVQFSAEEREWIHQDFLTQDFLMQVGQSQSFDAGQQLRYLADLIRRLPDIDRAPLQTQDDLITYLGEHATALA